MSLQKTIKIGTWNVNGTRSRLEQIKRLLEEQQPDILCLQEIKIANELWPQTYFEELGYKTQLVHGQKAYHGVAILSRLPLEEKNRLLWGGKDDKRHISATLKGSSSEKDLEIHCLYAPSGGPTANLEENPKFAQKIQYYHDMTNWFKAERSPHDKILVLGDLNIAPLEHDVWNHKKLLRSVGHTPLETQNWIAAQNSLNFEDLPRRGKKEDESVYSWWGYRYPKSVEKDYGWRLDHVWSTPALSPLVQEISSFKETRYWEKPSDHIPLFVTITHD